MTLSVVYPLPEHRVYEASTFLIGSVDPGQGLKINGVVMPVSASGFFSAPVELKPGENVIRLEALSASGKVQEKKTWTVYREKPFTTLPALPLALHEETLTPTGDLWLKPGDLLRVAFSGSVGVNATVSLPGVLNEPVPLTPKTGEGFIDNRDPVFAQLHQTRRPIPQQGFYETVLRIPEPKAHLVDSRLVLELKHKVSDTKEEKLVRELPSYVYVMTEPVLGQVKTDQAIARTFPVDGARLTPQCAGTWVHIDGLRHGWYRVRLDGEQVLWLRKEDVTRVEQPPVEPGRLSLISTKAIDPAKAQVHLTLSERYPLLIEADSNLLRLRLFGVMSQCDFIHYDPADPVIRNIVWRQPAADVMEVVFHVPGLAGYDYGYDENGLKLWVKRLPKQPGQIRVLIDPGHGGNETGTIGPDGTPEKAVNLAVSQQLQTALAQKGFPVFITRTADQVVSLEARAHQVIQTKADIVLSLHHNALPDGRNPLEHQGVSTYYYHDFSRPLAQALLHGMVSSTEYPVPNYGLLYDSLYMTRIHQALSVLLEVGFFTDPEEYERLINPAFQQHMAEKLADALIRYCQTQEPD